MRRVLVSTCARLIFTPSSGTAVGQPYWLDDAVYFCLLLWDFLNSSWFCRLPKFPYCNTSKCVLDRPLPGRRGRFAILLQQLQCRSFG